MRFDSAISSEMPIALIRFTASMKRVTTTGARPSKGSSSSKIDGESVMARPIATIFFWPPDRKSPRRRVKVLISGNRASTRSSIPPSASRPAGGPPRARATG